MRGRRIAADGEVSAPGDFQFQDLGYEGTDDPLACIAADKSSGGRGLARFEYACPRTGKPCGGIPIGHPEKPDIGRPSWRWDGNLEAPTLKPSINCQGGCGWHGWVTSGQFLDA